jgi:hypothetical protein
MIDKNNIDKVKRACTLLTEVSNSVESGDNSFTHFLGGLHLVSAIDELMQLINGEGRTTTKDDDPEED